MTIVHIHCPSGEYIGQARAKGFRKWRTLHRSKMSAEHALVGAIEKRGHSDTQFRVLFCAEWYEPSIVMECRRK